MKHSFKLLVSMKREPGGRPLYYKADGQRFGQEKTIKLNTDTQYRMDLSFTPPRIAQSVNFNGESLQVYEVTRDSMASAYSTFFHTNNLDVTKKGERNEAVTLIKLKNSGELKLLVQLKYYTKTNLQHSEWGCRFHCVEYLCNELDDRTSICVVDQTFR